MIFLNSQGPFKRENGNGDLVETVGFSVKFGIVSGLGFLEQYVGLGELVWELI